MRGYWMPLGNIGDLSQDVIPRESRDLYFRD